MSATSAGERLTVGSAEGNDLRVSDRMVSRYHLELRATSQGIGVLDLGSTNGTFVGAVRLERGVVPLDTVLTVGESRLAVGAGEDRHLTLHRSGVLGELRGDSAGMRCLMARIQQAALSEVSVLLTGESGTGKELVARAIHDLGPRSTAPFEVVDCGALAPALVASELFGHEKGAFTGADRRHMGAFERAQGGTVFLDEIGELPRSLQAMLLGTLDRRRLRRVGGSEEIDLDIRVVSATHRDLRGDVNEDRFRLDLYYRLAVVRLEIPPLRERIDDIPILVEHFLRQADFQGAIETILSAPVLRALSSHRWPGNVRELRNWVLGTLAMGEGQPLSHVGARAGTLEDPISGDVLHQSYKEARNEVVRQFERRYLQKLIARSSTVSEAAKVAGLDRSYLSSLLRRNGLR